MKLIVRVLIASVFLAGFAGAAVADTAEEVIKLTKEQWKADMAKDMDSSGAILADDYTEFNGDHPVRVDGKDLNMKLYEAYSQGEGSLIAAEMANEHVQVYGDVAILSYNFIGVAKSGEGETEPVLAKSTRVYAKDGGSWKLVHANFAPVSD